MIEFILLCLLLAIVGGITDGYFRINDRSSCSRLYRSKNIFSFLFTDRY